MLKEQWSMVKYKFRFVVTGLAVFHAFIAISSLYAYSNDDDGSSEAELLERFNYGLAFFIDIPLSGGGRNVYAPALVKIPKGAALGETFVDIMIIGNEAIFSFKNKDLGGRPYEGEITLKGSILNADNSYFKYINGVMVDEQLFFANYGSIKVGIQRKFGEHVKTGPSLEMRAYKYLDAFDTASELVLPSDTISSMIHWDLKIDKGKHRRMLELYDGFEFTLRGLYAKRTPWRDWGMPGEEGEFFDGDLTDEYYSFHARLHLGYTPGGYHNLQAHLTYAKGEHLDDLSRFVAGGALNFGDFNSLIGYYYRELKVGEIALFNFSYGFDLGKRLRLWLRYDTAHAPEYDVGWLCGLGAELRIKTYMDAPVRIIYGRSLESYSSQRRDTETLSIVLVGAF